LDCAATEIFVGDDARVEHVRVHRGGPQASSVATAAVAQNRGSHFTSRVFTFGGALARLELRVLLRGEGAECRLEGLYIAQKGDLVDHQTVVDHEKGRCTSRERYKGTIGGEGVAVFDGTVMVRHGASGTEAHQENRNLCLASNAVVHSKPHLEIETDDVKCSHGATVGRLDPNQLFYLRARGMNAELAHTVLTYAFAREMVQGVTEEALRDSLERTISDLLPHGSVARGLA
jgi:Fe-S cluster assembly protein SufD